MERLAIAFDRAQQAPWYRGKLDHIDPAKLGVREEWQKIPVIDKDVLRQLSHADFMDQLCIAKREDIAEYWRSGGTTGKPLFYPRTFADVRAALLSWHRSFPCVGAVPPVISATYRSRSAFTQQGKSGPGVLVRPRYRHELGWGRSDAIGSAARTY